ncbi:MAG: hypothetical protein PHW53_01320 [Patescibacteria group bacterium]|nr:hypothetical protein [Patescibacteria group bacterium]
MKEPPTNRGIMFVEYLEHNNPAILEHIFRPADRALRQTNPTIEELLRAFNLMIDFIDRKIQLFPRVSDKIARAVADEIAKTPNEMRKREAALASTSDDPAVKEWGELVICQEVTASLVITENDKVLEVLSRFFWGVFACLRRSPH